MITFQGGPMDGERVPTDFLEFDEIHMQNDENSPVYVYFREEHNYNYEGEFPPSEIEYEEDEDE